MADNAAHGGARLGAGRKRSGPANHAPGFASQGKGQRTLEGLAGFSGFRVRAQTPDDDSGASDSPGADASGADASESANVDATGAAATGSAAAGAAATSPGQGSPAPESPAPESDAAAAVEQAPDPTQARCRRTRT